MSNFNKLIEIVQKLRAPDGCEWDREQTHESLTPYLLEETYEVLEAIDNKAKRLADFFNGKVLDIDL